MRNFEILAAVVAVTLPLCWAQSPTWTVRTFEGSGSIVYQCTENFNVRSQYGDIGSMGPGIDKADKCAWWCTNKLECDAFVYVNEWCYFKTFNSVGPVATSNIDTNWENGVKAGCVKHAVDWKREYPDGTIPYDCTSEYDIQGRDLDLLPNQNRYMEYRSQCSDACSRRRECAFFIYEKTKACYLKAYNGGQGSTGPKTGVDAACKKADPPTDILEFEVDKKCDGSWWKCLAHYDVKGEDIAGYGPGTPGITSESDCATKCSETNGCQFFVWTGGYGCYLKKYVASGGQGETGWDINTARMCARMNNAELAEYTMAKDAAIALWKASKQP